MLAHGSDAARTGVQQEIQAVLGGASSSREGTLCCQAVFALLDTLQKWHGDAQAAAQKAAEKQKEKERDGQKEKAKEGPVALGPQWDCIHRLLEAMPKQLLARAAQQVGRRRVGRQMRCGGGAGRCAPHCGRAPECRAPTPTPAAPTPTLSPFRPPTATAATVRRPCALAAVL